MKRAIRAAVALLTLPVLSFSQDFLGFSNSNWSGVTGIYYNPANIADNRMKFDMDLVGFNFSFANNYIGLKHEALKQDKGYIDSGMSKIPFFKHMRSFSDPDFQNKYLVERMNGDKKSVFLGVNTYLPSFMFKLNGKMSIGFSWRERNYVNVDGIEPDFAHQIWTGIYDSTQFHKRLTNDKVSIQAMMWGEYGVTLARNVYENGTNFIKAGVTLKMLQGLGAAYMFINHLDYDFTHHDTVSIYDTDVNYGHSTNIEADKGNLKYKYVSNINFGGDLGVVYEYRPEPKEYKYDMDGEENITMSWENKYKLRMGLSLLDLGYIKYQKGPYSRDFHADTRDWYTHNLTFDGYIHDTTVTGADSTYLSNVPPVASFDDTLFNRFQMNTSDKYFKMNLPTVLNFNVDYNLAKNLYVNFDAFMAFRFNNNPNKVHEISLYSITPRWDHRWFGVFVPFSINAYRNFNVGTDIRLGPLIFGANNLFQFFNKKKDIYAADFHVMLKMLIPFRHPHDRDHDKVSDRKDKCPDTPGVWEFAGCPDRDHDHVQDKDDLCPDDPGLPEFQGCPDRDGDKIVDSKDNCPDEPGLAEFNGCPDRDKDGIMDKEDNCPDDPGIKMFAGCPDTDHDSIMDKDDKCPTIAGPIENRGCPYDKLFLIDKSGNVLAESTVDKDGNFIFPSLPPDEVALFKLQTYNEPPEKKEVKVGISSSLVRIAKKGEDTYFRFEILKSDEKKLKNLNEPDVKVVILTKQEEEVLKKAFDNLEFETAKDIIKSDSYSALNELAGLLKKKPNWRIQLSGHTDNQGGASANMMLSKKRATAVKKYLAAQGIAEDRFIVKWYGQTKPIADNKTPQGRQKNRRVEMLIIE